MKKAFGKVTVTRLKVGKKKNAKKQYLVYPYLRTRHIRFVESLPLVPETNMTLYVNYTGT